MKQWKLSFGYGRAKTIKQKGRIKLGALVFVTLGNSNKYQLVKSYIREFNCQFCFKSILSRYIKDYATDSFVVGSLVDSEEIMKARDSK